MGDQQCTTAEPHHTSEPNRGYESFATVQTSAQDMPTPANGNDSKPLPIGSWILPFHGTCPRCRHYHKAVQVKIEVTQDPNQASYIHCDNCKDPWAAFSARNSTQISLLSTATTELDFIEKEVRHKLIDIVKIATAKADLGTLDNPTTPAVLRQPSINAPRKDVPSILPRPDDNGTVRERAQRRQSDTFMMPNFESPRASSWQRSNLSRLFSKVKTKIAARMPRLYRGHTLQSPDVLKLPEIPATRSNQPAVQSLVHASADTVPQLHDNQVHQDIPALASSTANTSQSAKLAEVATFIASLDASVLDFMTDDERTRWMRKAYTDFKARNRRSISTPGLSPIVENAVVLPVVRFNRRSDEVRYAGAHLEGLEHVQRRFSTSSDAYSDARSYSEDGTYVNTVVTAPGNPSQRHLHHLRHGSHTQRPHSLPNATLTNRTHRRGRGSLDSRMFMGAGSTLSLRGQAASLRSQGSVTLNESNLTVYQTLSEAIVRPSQSLESLDLLPPTPINSGDQSESPTPSGSPLRQNSDSRR